MQILTIVGARPQFVKAAVVSRAIGAYNSKAGVDTVKETIIHTGQHYDYNMSDVFFDEMEIPRPAVNLSVGSGNHGEMTGSMLAAIEREMIERKPDITLVYGDTNSTMAGALAAVKLHIPVAHVEAGLRSFNRAMPEEINRVVTDHVSTILFCPSDSSASQLAREGITSGVHVVGDVMYDAVIHYGEKAAVIKVDSPFALCTIHRAENTDDMTRFNGILEGLSRSPVQIFLALHPRTRAVVEKNGVKWPSNVIVHEPFSYFNMLGYLKACSFVITDSGGLQKEAYFFGKKCVTVRDETEWTELVEAGANRVAGTEPDRIAEAIEWAANGGLGSRGQIYGKGNAGELIVNTLAALGES